MDGAKIRQLLNLIERVRTFPPATDGDPAEMEVELVRLKAIITKAEREIDAELVA